MGKAREWRMEWEWFGAIVETELYELGQVMVTNDSPNFHC